MSHVLIKLCLRLLVVVLVAAVAALLPLPVWAPTVVVYVHVPLISFLAICTMGKLLIDTLFYPRHP